MGTLANIPIGAGKITFAGVDLGFTVGGITLTIEEQATPIQVDQYASCILNEIIHKTAVKFKVPLAEGALLSLMESIFAGRDVSSYMFALESGVGIDRYLNAGTLILELLTDETTVETAGVNTPNKYYFHKAAPKGAVTITYAGWEKQIVYEIEIECYPAIRDTGTFTTGTNYAADATKAWVADIWAGYIFTDSLGVQFVITANTATQLTTVGNPSSGAGSINPPSKRCWGTGTGILNTWTKTTPATNWTVNEWTGYTLTDEAGVEFAIASNSATALTVSGTPSTGDYTITTGAGKGTPKLGYRGKV